MTREDTLCVVCAIIADTFAAPLALIDADTTAEDIDGWDSLGHTILMVRLERRLRVAISERVASEIQTVGDLADALAALSQPALRRASGQ